MVVDRDKRNSQCACGGTPVYVGISTRGGKESIMVTGELPNAFRMECNKCGYKTHEHHTPAEAEAEWEVHANGGGGR